MQYFGASLLTLLGLANSLQCTEVNGGHNTWSNGPRARLQVHPHIEEWPYSGDHPSKKVIHHKKNEPLNMTCTVVNQDGEKESNAYFDYIVDWKGPRHITNNPKIETGQSRNMAWIWFERLAEEDAGDYTCIAVSHKPLGHQSKLSVFFFLFVEHKPMYCGPQWFRCRSKECIMPRYVCDGHPDCNGGEDESPAAGCGSNPCLGKIFCEKRCIPADWCCDHRNCSGTFELRPWPHENHEISYVQTAFYTVIGCAMAFMFIVTILVIAICRVQIKRAMNSRCSQQYRNPCARRTVPLYDLDVWLNRTAETNCPGGVSIMYNINSGVQFVGRPAEPPPYSAVVSEPPREGPPPPYASCENLIVRQLNPRFVEGAEVASAVDAISVATPNDRPVDDGFRALPSDTDVRIVGQRTNVGVHGRRDDSVANVAAPQVANHGSAGRSRTAENREIFGSWVAPNARRSRDLVDGTSNAAESSTNIVRSSRDFELEYAETDALLVTNPGNDEVSGGKNAVWKPCGRATAMKPRWSNVGRSEKNSDKNWYRERNENMGEDGSSRGSRDVSTSRDSENEGVFLDTDQQDSGVAEIVGGGDTDVASGFSNFGNVVDRAKVVNDGDAAATPTPSPSASAASCSKSGKTDEERIAETNGNPKKQKSDAKYFRKEKCKSEVMNHRSSRSPPDRSFLRDVKRQSSLTSDEIRSKNIGESSASVSDGNVDAASPRVTDKDADSTIGRVSNLVLPLRESFIGVQRDG